MYFIDFMLLSGENGVRWQRIYKVYLRVAQLIVYTLLRTFCSFMNFKFTDQATAHLTTLTAIESQPVNSQRTHFTSCP
jgi:hypothetical protein